MQNNINSYQNLKVSIKVITKDDSTLLGIASIFFDTQSFGFVRVSGFRIMKPTDYEVKGNPVGIPSDIDIKPPKIGKYYIFFFDDSKEESKKKWDLLRQFIYKAYLHKKAKLESELESMGIDELDLDEISEGIEAMQNEAKAKTTAEEL